jgi:hypothetical protein
MDTLGTKFYSTKILVLAKDVDQFTVFCAEQCEEPMRKFLYIHSTNYLSNLPLKEIIVSDIVQLQGWEKNPDYDKGTFELIDQLHQYRQMGLV